MGGTNYIGTVDLAQSSQLRTRLPCSRAPRINRRNVASAVDANSPLSVYILLEVLCDGPFASFPSARSSQGSRV